jgi:hypothetical protein
MSEARKCVCGHDEDEHGKFMGGCAGVRVDRSAICGCPQFRPACPVDEQQCDAECQARPDRACAADPKSEESVYDLARRTIREAGERAKNDRSLDYREEAAVRAALDAGEAAEKRAEEAEKREEKWRWMVREAELRSIPDRIQQQDLLQEASGKYRKRAEAAERERDEAKTRADRLEQVLKAIGEHEEYDRCGCACDKPAARAALDPPKEG